MDTTAHALSDAHALYARATSDSRPPVYKAIGISLAIASGCFIGVSFVLKKTGLLKANVRYNEEAGEGYGYLKNAYWWTGMTLMIIGEVCNFVAYAFVDAILVTPLGALSVVITTILSAIFLKERLSFVGKVGCFNCIIGSVVIVMNAPQQSSVARIQDMKRFVLAPGFLSYAGVIIVGSAFIALWAGPRYGKKSMLVYLSVCSLIGGLSVVATQGLGAAVVAQAGGTPQFNQWFLYVLLVFVVVTLVTEIIYLNKALNLFNAALVTPTYYVFFTSSTIVTSAILFQGFKGTPTGIATVIMGFLQICAGVILLQLSKSAKDVPDAAVFKGDLNQMREVAEQEQPESEPKADAIRGTAALIRRISVSRQKMEQEEAKRYRDEKLRDQMDPIAENEIVEWDGLRRRKTVVGETPLSPRRRKTLHPPLGMSHFPDPNEDEEENDRRSSTHEPRESQGFFESVRNRAQSVLLPGQRKNLGHGTPDVRSPMHPVALTEISVQPSSKAGDTPTTAYSNLPYEPGSLEEAQEHIYGLPPSLVKRNDAHGSDSGTHSPHSVAFISDQRTPSNRSAGHRAPEPPPHTTRRQFSFQNVFHRKHADEAASPSAASSSIPIRTGLGSRQSSNEQRRAAKNATEEERLGLVKGESHALATSHSLASHKIPESNDEFYGSPTPSSEDDEEDDWQIPPHPSTNQSHRAAAQRSQRKISPPSSTTTNRQQQRHQPIRQDSQSPERERETEGYEASRRRWEGNNKNSPPQGTRNVVPGLQSKRRSRGSEVDIKAWEAMGSGGDNLPPGGSGGGAFI